MRFFDLGERERRLASVARESVGLHDHRPCRVRDLWAGEDLGVFTGDFTTRGARCGFGEIDASFVISNTMCRKIFGAIAIFVFSFLMLSYPVRTADAVDTLDILPSHNTALCSQAYVPPTPNPDADWSLAALDSAEDWSVYFTGSDISAIVPDGPILWAASDGGLLRWDRRSGDVLQYTAPYVPLLNNNLSDLLLYDNKLYISTRSGISIFDRGETWQTVTTQTMGLEMGYFSPLAMIDDVLWVGGKGGIALRYPDGHWEHISAKKERFPFPNVEKIVQRADGIYIEVAKGIGSLRDIAVVKRVNGKWKTINNVSFAYLQAPDGSLWKGEGKALLKSIDSGVTWKTIFTGEGYWWLKPLAFDLNSRLYVSEDDTILVLEDDQIVEQYCFTDSGPELRAINVIVLDETDRLWAATDGWGLTMYDGQNWHNWQPENSDLREDAIRGLAVTNDRVYAGVTSSSTGGGVSIYDIKRNQWTNYWPEESELSGGGVRSIVVAPDGRVYLPTAAGVLDIYDHETWEHIVIPPLPADEFDEFQNARNVTVKESLFDGKGHLWLAADNFGVLEYDGNEWHTYPTPGGANALALDPDGRLWFGTHYGLGVRDLDGSWYHYTGEALPIGGHTVFDIAVDSEGRVWALGPVLGVFNGQEWQTFTPDVVGSRGWGGSLDFDQYGRLWIDVSSGIAMYQGEVGIGPFVELVDPPPMEDTQIVATHGMQFDRFLLLFLRDLCIVVILIVGGLIIVVLFIKHKRQIASDKEKE